MTARPVLAIETDATGRGVIRAIDGSRDILATVVGGNPLSPNWTPPAQLGDSPRLVTWSGTLADDLFAGHPGNWMPTGIEALQRLVAGHVADARSHGTRWCLRPHARHVLSDVPSCRRFLQQHAAASIELALEPAALLEPVMLSGLDEHLQRMFEALGGSAAFVLLTDAAVDDDAQRVMAVAPGSGVLPGGLLAHLLDQHVPAETPVVLPAATFDAHRAWLGL